MGMVLTDLTFAILNGLTSGTLLMLTAMGLTLVFGIMNILNFAHGSLFMIGGYLLWAGLFYNNISFISNFWVLAILSIVIVGLLAALIEKYLISRIYDKNHEYQLLLTFALVLVLDNSVRLIFGTQSHIVSSPSPLDYSIKILGSSFPVYNIFVMIVGIVLITGLFIFFNYVKLGKIVRASAENAVITEAMGINVKVWFTIMFAVGGMLAGIGGILSVPYASVNPLMGENIIVESFIVVVVGGLGSFSGAFAVALLIGILNGIGYVIFPLIQPYIPYLLMAIVLLFRPEGIFSEGKAI